MKVDRLGNPAPQLKKREAIIANRESFILKTLACQDEPTSIRKLTEAFKSIPKNSKEYKIMKVKEIAWPTVNRYVEDLKNYHLITITQDTRGRRDKKCELSPTGVISSWINGRMDEGHVLAALLSKSEVAKVFKGEIEVMKPMLVNSLTRPRFDEWAYLVTRSIASDRNRGLVFEDFYEYAIKMIVNQIFLNLVKAGNTGPLCRLTKEERQDIIDISREKIADLTTQINEKKRLIAALTFLISALQL